MDHRQGMQYRSTKFNGCGRRQDFDHSNELLTSSAATFARRLALINGTGKESLSQADQIGQLRFRSLGLGSIMRKESRRTFIDFTSLVSSGLLSPLSVETACSKDSVTVLNPPRTFLNCLFAGENLFHCANARWAN